MNQARTNLGSPDRAFNHPHPFRLSLSKPLAALRQAQRERFCRLESQWVSGGTEYRHRYQAARASSGLRGAPGRRSVTFSQERTPWLPLSARISSKPAPMPRMAAELRLGAMKAATASALDAASTTWCSSANPSRVSSYSMALRAMRCNAGDVFRSIARNVDSNRRKIVQKPLHPRQKAPCSGVGQPSCFTTIPA